MNRIALSAAVVTLLSAAGVTAQDTPMIIMGQYMRCGMGQQARADEIALNVWGPVAQKQVDAGNLDDWGYLAHVQGGAWRRIFTLRGTDLAVMMDASAAITEEIGAQHADVAAEMGTICPSHDDYIWTSVVNSPPNPDPTVGPASMSTYYMCDVTREARANEIFEELMAPLYQKHTDMGHLAGWAFFAHRHGGHYRRLETFSGPDHKTLLNMQDAIYQEAMEIDALAFSEFRQICDTHTDYMWSNAKQQ